MKNLLLSAAVILGATVSARADVPNIVTDIPAVHSLTQMVTGELGIPTLLIDGIADPHHVHLRPSQVRAITNADIAIWVGPELTPWLEDVLTTGSSVNSLALMNVDGTVLRYFDDHADPHAWLDPENAGIWLTAIGQVLAQADPDNATRYTENAVLARQSLTELHAKVYDALKPAQTNKLIVAHDAFGYFADRFDLNIVATLADGDAADPGARRLSELRALVQVGDIDCVFSEPGQDVALAQTITDGTPTPTGELDPTGANLSPGSDLYASLLRNIATNINACLDTAN